MSQGVGTAPTVGKEKRLLEQMRVKQYSWRTEQTYCEWPERCIRFHVLRHPREMDEAEIAAFLSYLAIERNIQPTSLDRPPGIHLDR